MNVNDFYKYAKQKLHYMNKQTLNFELKALLKKILNFKDVDFILNREKQLSNSELKQLKKAIEMRSKRVPLQYILGNWTFMDISLKVGKGVLIPREDTQVLVEVLNENIKQKSSVNIIDLCSGSGCISFAIEKLNKNINKIYALEKSKEAYNYLIKNICSLKSNVEAINGDVFTEYKNFEDNFFDFIVSNPPYIKTEEIDFLEQELLYEPKMALDGGKNGLIFYENICKLWISKLKPGGSLIFEIGKGQFEDVSKIMVKNNLNQINYKKDINGIIRTIIGKIFY